MILLCGDGLTAIEVSQRLSKRLGSIQKWRKRYLEVGLSGLEDQPRSGVKQLFFCNFLEGL